ncbi:MAG: VWA domain-containing protein [Dongiaceae bacterium]
MTGAASPAPRPSAGAWDDAIDAAALLAVDPAGLGGAAIRAPAGAVRDAWLAALRRALPPGAPFRRIPLNAPDERLLGGLDLAATLQGGRPVARRGLLAEADGGVVLLAMAERMSALMAARIAAALDTGEMLLQRDGVSIRSPARIGVIALDEGLEEERPPPALLDRLAFHLDLGAVRPSEAVARQPDPGAIEAASRLLPAVDAADDLVEALAAAAAALGADSLRALLLAVRARASRPRWRAAARSWPRMRRWRPGSCWRPARSACRPRPRPSSRPGRTRRPRPRTPPRGRRRARRRPIRRPSRRASRRSWWRPPGRRSRPTCWPACWRPDRRRGGRAARAAPGCCRPARCAAGRPGPAAARCGRGTAQRRRDAARCRAVAAAAPRADAAAAPRLAVRAEDFRTTRYRQRAQTTAIFVVDASGSSALHRLAEAKGAVEQLLADCYVRRDQVAVLAFRGRGVELLLPPTRSLVRAKRSLAGLPGGGATPLAAALDAAGALADAVRRRGATPVLVLLTDGRANLARDGTAGRERAEADALAAAAALRAAGTTGLLVDTAPRPQEAARRIAAAMGARYLPLPQLDPALLSRAVRSVAASG